MHFLYPVFLSALAVLLIPVVIHLFHFRRFKTVMFSNVKFLKAVETERKNRNRLKHLLVLSARCLAFASLVFAFAIPGCGEKKRVNGKAAVCIFIDNSFSMDHRNGKGILLETAKQKAREIVSSLGGQSEFQILSCEPNLGSTTFVSPSDAIRKIDDIQVSPRSPSLGKIWKQMHEALQSVPNENRQGFLISDFQTSFMREMPNNPPESELDIRFVQLENIDRKNLSVDSAWLENPFAMAGEKTNIKFKISNFSNEKIVDLNVRLLIDNNLGGIAKLEIQPQGNTEATIGFVMPKININRGILEIDDPENTFDNRLFFSLQPQGDLQVYFTGNNSYLEKALNTNSFFKISKEINSMASVYYLSDSKGVEVTEASKLSAFVENGGRLVVIPSAVLPKDAFAGLETIFGLPQIKEVKKGRIKIDKKGLNHVFFNQVFSGIPQNMEMPMIYQYYSTGGSLGNGDAVLALENGDPFLIRVRFGKGYLYFFTSAFETSQSNFVQSALFLPVTANCAFNYEQTGSLFGLTASNKGYLLKNKFKIGESNLLLTGDKGEFNPEVQNGVAGQELFLGSWLKEAGFYLLSDKNNANIKELISLNYPRTESNPATANGDMIENFEQKTGAKQISENKTGFALQQVSTDNRLWRLFIWLAAAFFAVEVLLLVFWDPVSTQLSSKTKHLVL